MPNVPMDFFQKAYDWLYEMFVTNKVIKKFDIRTFNALVGEMYILKSNFGLWESIAAKMILEKYISFDIICDI